MDMKELICARLRDIERKYDVRVLLAVESGSRAWGFASPDSDFDVRFIYVHRREWYLSLFPGRDVIEEMDSETELDMAGWDLRKALTLMSKGNAMFVEWLGSPICYIRDDDFFNEISAQKDAYFQKVRCVHHYFHMATNHDERYIEKRGCELKRFMYYSRGLLAARWAWEHGTYPPVPYMELVDALVDDDTVKDGLKDIVRIKAESKEYDRMIVADWIVDWFSDLQTRISDTLDELGKEELPGIGVLDGFFLKTLDRVWQYELPQSLTEAEGYRGVAVIFSGIQASGKSTFFRECFEPAGFLHVSMDLLHNRNKEEEMIRGCIESGQSFVVDNTNPTASERRRYLDMLEGSGYLVCCCYFQSRVQDCIRRNRLRGETVPDKAVAATSNRLELPSSAEGYDRMYYIRIREPRFEVSQYNEKAV